MTPQAELEPPATLAEAIERLRIHSRITKKALAAKSGLAPRTLYAYLNGTQKIKSVDHVWRLSQTLAYQISADPTDVWQWFFGTAELSSSGKVIPTLKVGPLIGDHRLVGSLERRVAVHEAGHAAVACILNRPFRAVSLDPQADSLGRVSGSVFGASYKTGDKEGRTDRENQIMVLLAGRAAEASAFGRYSKQSVSGDMQEARKLTRHMTGGNPKETKAYLDWLMIRTQRMMKWPGMWPAVNAIADKLIETRGMTARTTRNIFERSRADYFRRLDTRLKPRKTLK